MIIDYNRLVLMLLPSFLRRVRLVALMRVLVSPVGRLAAELSEWFEWRRIRMAATPQAKWIEYVVRRDAGVVASIREGGHRPWDFIVMISIDETNVDQVDAKRKTESLVNRYKQAGRRWIFDNEMLTPSTRFDGFVCQMEQQTARFDGFVCELDDQRPACRIQENWATSMSITACGAYSEFPVDSEVVILARCEYSSTEGDMSFTKNLIIKKGEYFSEEIIGTSSNSGWDIRITFVSLNKDGDDVYKYKIANF